MTNSDSETQPQFIDGRWYCPNLPKGKICCPSGPTDQATQAYWRKGYAVHVGGCPDDPDLVACGPKPPGNVICCPAAHTWIPETAEMRKACPIAEEGKGIDVTTQEILSRAPGRIKMGGDVTVAKLALIAVPMLAICGVLLYLIIR